MPVTPTYPGVYIEEVSSGVRTLAGVATSTTAFVGRAKRGPVDEPVFINSYAEFERIFGGLWTESSLSFAVRDFYLNGGSQAIIVRLAASGRASPDTNATKAQISITAGGETLVLEAVNPGTWGNKLKVRITGVTGDNFNMEVLDGSSGAVESFFNLSVAPTDTRRADEVLENKSKLIRVNTLPGSGNTPDSPAVPEGTDPWEEPTLHHSAVSPLASDGSALIQDDFTDAGKAAAKTGLYALEKADIFNLLCIPPYKSDGNADTAVIGAAAAYCEKRRAFLIVDPPSGWNSKESAKTGAGDFSANIGTNSKNAAVFFPRLRQPNPLKENQLEDFAPCGAVAGVIARTDAARGLWKAPAGLEATLTGVPALSVSLTDLENGELNPLGVNCLRAKPPAGRIVWGARTLQGNDQLASEWKYIPVRRMALYIEESLFRGSQWVVFEPNDEPLWAQIRLGFGSFMHGLFRQGAFQGASPKEAYFVKCDKETTTQDDVNLGRVNIMVGFAPLKPAEFVIIKLQQMAGQ